MKCTLLAGLMIAMLACCGGCMTQTVTGMTNEGMEKSEPLSTNTYWIWQGGFWQHK